MNRSFLFILMLSLFLLIVFSGCKKDFYKDYKSCDNHSSLALYVRDGKFVVKDWKTLIEISDSLYKLDYEDYMHWLSRYGIRTIYSEYLKAVKKDEDMDDYYESLPPEKIQLLRKSKNYKLYSDYTIALANIGIVNLVTNDTTALIELPEGTEVYAPLLSLDGAVYVGDKLIVMNKAMGKNISPDDGISFFCNYPKIDIGTEDIKYYWIKKRWRVGLEARYITSENKCTSDPYDYYVYYKVLFHFEKKNIWGKWKSRYTSWRIKGYVMKKFTDLNGRDITGKVYIYQSFARTPVAHLIALSEGGDMRDYIHTVKPISDYYQINTRKDTVYGDLKKWLEDNVKSLK